MIDRLSTMRRGGEEEVKEEDALDDSILHGLEI